ncbi:MAG: hypothetical protein IT442_03045 [Phycisphaeraceae bacterium]|nr:hypothetical protein [Phycisphaeraceae bacterium]
MQTSRQFSPLAGDLADDLPGTRRAIEAVAVKPYIYFMLFAALLGAVLFLVGIYQLAAASNKAVDVFPAYFYLIAVGYSCFAFFFNFFLILYHARHFLLAIKKLECENAELRVALLAMTAKTT